MPPTTTLPDLQSCWSRDSCRHTQSRPRRLVLDAALPAPPHHCRLPRPLRPQRRRSRGTQGARRPAPPQALASTPQGLLTEGKRKFEEGDRNAALKLFEQVLDKTATPEERQEALYGATVAHASFGDVEMAQITLRQAIGNGLDFDAALKNPNYVPFVGSPQVKIQLKRFADALLKIKAAVSPSGGAPQGAAPAPGRRPSFLDSDISKSLNTEITGIDPSLGGVIKRVLGLLAASLVLGLVLWFIGYEYVFKVPSLRGGPQG